MIEVDIFENFSNNLDTNGLSESKKQIVGLIFRMENMFQNFMEKVSLKLNNMNEKMDNVEQNMRWLKKNPSKFKKNNISFFRDYP